MSLPIVVLVALAFRLGYTLSQTHKIPPEVLRAVPYLYEPGNIAYSIADGHGFGSPFRADTGPTAWTAPIYPYIVAGFFHVFGTYSYNAFLAAISLNMLCLSLIHI